MRLGDLEKAAIKEALESSLPPRGKSAAPAVHFHFHERVSVFFGADVPRLAVLLAMRGQAPNEKIPPGEEASGDVLQPVGKEA